MILFKNLSKKKTCPILEEAGVKYDGKRLVTSADKWVEQICFQCPYGAECVFDEPQKVIKEEDNAD